MADPINLKAFIDNYLGEDDVGRISTLVALIENAAKVSDISYLELDLKIPGSTGVKVDTGNKLITMTLPTVFKEYVPVISVDGKMTFAYIDIKTAIVHELSHIALQFMGLDSELNNARLAAAVRAAGGVTNIDSIKLNLQKNITELSPNSSDASFENIFNTDRGYWSSITGTEASGLYRAGYNAYGDWSPDTPNPLPVYIANGTSVSIIGNNEDNTELKGGKGNDYLDGGAGNDVLLGGTGYDTYYSGDGDTINDDDGKGEVNFEGFKLTGGTLTESRELYKKYVGDGGTYYLLRTTNTLIYQKGNQFLTIEKYHKENNDLGIKLDSELPELTIIGHMANENEGTVTGKVVLTQAYGRDIIIHLSTLDDSAHAGEDYHSNNNITVTIRAGETEGDFSVNLIDNQIVEGRETFFTQIDSVTDTSNQPIQYTIKDITPLTIEDDDGLNVSVFAPTVSENAGIATGAVTINKTQYNREVAA